MPEWILSGGRYENTPNMFEHKLYALNADEKRQIVRILERLKPLIKPDRTYTFERAIRDYKESFAVDNQEVRLCTYLWNLVRSRVFPHISYEFWLGEHGVTIMGIAHNLDKFQDAQLRWVDSLIAEFSEKQDEDQGQEKAGDPGQQEAAPNE